MELAVHNTGRPTKYTENNIEKLLVYIRMGSTKTEAAALVGIHRDTLNTWEHTYPEFAEAIKLAEYQQLTYLLLSIRKAGEKDWRACAWLLERRYPEKFSLKSWARNKKCF